jgi:hypothetical protein
MSFVCFISPFSLSMCSLNWGLSCFIIHVGGRSSGEEFLNTFMEKATGLQVVKSGALFIRL